MLAANVEPNQIPFLDVNGSGTEGVDRGTVAADGALSHFLTSTTLKLTAALTKLQVGEYLKTEAKEYLKVMADREKEKQRVRMEGIAQQKQELSDIHDDVKNQIEQRIADKEEKIKMMRKNIQEV